VKTVESSSREIGRVLGQDPKGGDGVTAEVGTHVTVTVGGGPSAAKVPVLRDPHPEEPTPMLGDQTGTPNDRGSADRNVEQRPSVGTEVEPEDPVVNAEEPASDLATVLGVMSRND
jgi:beta-lactam-binding protein with PASTA domain